jgi:proteasome assembly chaperone (PAC2) family protein
MNETPNLIFESKPDLRQPYVVCGFEGSVNSGNVSEGGVAYLIRQYKAVKFAEMSTSRYHVYQIPGVHSQGPVFKMQDGLITDSQFPSDRFFYAKNAAVDHDLILFAGSEPNLNWEEYTETVVDLAQQFGAVRLVTMGGLLEEAPYTREPQMTCTCTSLQTRTEMEKYNVLLSNREGPATFNQMLLYSCRKKGLDGIGFNVRVPYYPQYNIGLGNSPRSMKAIMIRLNHILHLNLNFDELDDAINELVGKLDFVRQQNPQFNTYIEELEKDYVDMSFQETLDISPNEAIRFAEEFLREKQDHS